MNSSMFTLSGEVVHVFISPKNINKNTGEEYGGDDKVQIIGDIPLNNGQNRKDLITLTTDQGEAMQKLIGRPVSAPVSFYAPSKGQVSFFIPKGHKVTLDKHDS